MKNVCWYDQKQQLSNFFTFVVFFFAICCRTGGGGANVGTTYVQYLYHMLSLKIELRTLIVSVRNE